MKFRCSLGLALLLAFVSTGHLHGQESKQVAPALPAQIADGVNWRSIGPANMGGRITSITVYENDPSTWWVSTASGGLLKTVNNGVDFEHQFDDQATVSIGEVEVSQSDPNIVWVGTGENNPRNSVSWGDGVYKSTDGGKTWKNMGLKKIFQTGSIAIHPTNPDIVWVGALGRLWGPNPERGLYKTMDGGKTWEQILFVDDNTGVIELELNPKNPDELLVATYERKRGGFDVNDPEKRFGEGAGIYKSTNGGKSFKKVTKGLPTCKLGRIGFDYYEKDPNYVFAVIESEKIGTPPEKFPFVGVRNTEAEVGVKLTRITPGSPAEKAGLKPDDIILTVDGRFVMSNNEMLEEVYKHQAGEKVKLMIVRDKKKMDMELTLSESKSRVTYFRGTLGGQYQNRQTAQGEEGFQYGGVYMSKDGGSSWERINSLNPRPMYYSHIQVDPVDRNNIYLCGTSLYKSSDGGKTFTGDGGSDGIHVDHHALWIDKRDPRHMILGNDGGIHVTYDRMAHWDHLNHVAIGQFYHVGVDSTDNYMVYGGLQDNGSWGGPSRSDVGGMVNSDWIRVGGGDGFVTLADPNDPQQIYYESQNGGMGRIHLGTGARGSARPRRSRGTNYVFNWKTPFILSPHNSKVHYSAGNYVFRSFSKGDSAKRISPRITNTTQSGAGTAISESPVEAGVIYVGTNDGAVWMTKDGGNQWSPLFYSPQKPKSEKKEGKKDAAEGDSDKKSEAKKADAKAESKKPVTKKPINKKPKAVAKADAQASPSDKMADAKKPAAAKTPKKKTDKKEAVSIDGLWKAKLITDRIPANRANFELKLKQGKNGKFTGTYSGRSGESEVAGTFDPKTGKVSFEVEARTTRVFTAVISGNEMTGELSTANGRIQIPFKATRSDESSKSAASGTEVSVLPTSFAAASISMLTANEQADPITGVWKGKLSSEELPDGEIEFSLELKMDAKNKVTGSIVSTQGVLDINEGVYNPKRKRLILNAGSETLDIEILGSLRDDGKIDGTVFIEQANLEIEFEVAREKGPEKAEAKPKNTEAKKAEPKKATPKKAQEKKPTAKKADSKQAAKTKDSKAAPSEVAKQEKDSKQESGKSGDESVTAGKDDPITGTWTGKMVSRGSERDLKFTLIRKDNSNITGTFETGQGEREITSGQFDSKSNTLSLMADSDRFSLEFNGKVAGDSFDGELDSGRFNMEFTVKRTSKSVVKAKETKAEAEATVEGPTGEGTLASMMPGPRWVSSIEASRFKAGRCYITFDGHRSDDDASYAFVTEDYGKTWKSLLKNLPPGCGSVRVLREDIVNENLLYLGCEFSSWWSIDRGETWTKMGGLPTVAVHEFAIHPTQGEVVAGTHGRSLWIADVSMLRQLTPARLQQDSFLLKSKDVVRRQRKPGRGDSGTRRFVGQNPSSATKIGYALGKNARSVSLRILNLNGDVIQEFDEVSRRKGFHSYEWDTRRIAIGSYRVELKVDGAVQNKTLTVKTDPSLSSAARAVLEAEDELTEFDEALEASMIED